MNSAGPGNAFDGPSSKHPAGPTITLGIRTWIVCRDGDVSQLKARRENLKLGSSYD